MTVLRQNRRWLLFPVDSLLLAVAFYLSWVLCFDGFYPQKWAVFLGWDEYLTILFLQLLSAMGAFLFLGIYRNLWAYASLHDVYQIIKATLLSALLGITVLWFYNRMENFPRSAFILEYILLFLFLGFRSFSWRMMREFKSYHRSKSNKKSKRTLLIGKQDSISHLIRELRTTKLGYSPIVLLDETVEHTKAYIQGLPVIGGKIGNDKKLRDIFQKYSIEQVILTEKISGEKMRLIYRTCEANGIHCKTLPSLEKILNGSGSVINALREIQIEDLLGRDAIQLKTKEIHRAIKGQTILVTGAGGSIASELCRQLLEYEPGALVLLELSENALYEIDHELRNKSNISTHGNRNFRFTSILGSIQDEETVQRIFYENDIQLIFHCAACKHVPLMEFNPKEAIRNNLLGTVKLAKAAQNAGVEKFVMLSTDKAVNPSNIMGATKRIAELYIQNLARASDTRFLSVRFGNVLGSSGSVVPLFSKQIAMGGPVTITHPEITRYFMTIPESVGLVIQAGVMGKGGEVFVLDMGEPVKIKELAEDMIRFSGLRPHQDISFEYIGLRPGEKLFEELFLEEEGRKDTAHEKIGVVMGRSLNLETLTKQILELDEVLAENNRNKLDAAISRIIPEYRRAYYSREGNFDKENFKENFKENVHSRPRDASVKSRIG